MPPDCDSSSAALARGVPSQLAKSKQRGSPVGHHSLGAATRQSDAGGQQAQARSSSSCKQCPHLGLRGRASACRPGALWPRGIQSYNLLHVMQVGIRVSARVKVRVRLKATLPQHNVQKEDDPTPYPIAGGSVYPLARPAQLQRIWRGP